MKIKILIGLLLIVSVVLIGGYVQEGKKVGTKEGIAVNDDAGTPSSPMDLVLSISPFSEEREAEIIVKFGAREGYPTEGLSWNNTNAEIKLPEGLELIEGNLTWQGDIVGDEVIELKIKVKTVKNGEWKVEATSRAYLTEDEWFGDIERFYVLITDDEVLVSDKPLAKPTKEEGLLEELICPSGFTFDPEAQKCIITPEVRCPQGYIWNEEEQKCIAALTHSCPNGYLWSEIDQKCIITPEPQ